MTGPALDLLGVAELEPLLADAVRRLVAAGFHALWRGDTPTIAALSADDPMCPAAADHLRERGRIELADDGRIVGIHGLAHRPTRHRIEHADGVINTWCALDAVAIPASLRIAALAITTCLTCEHHLTVVLIDGHPRVDSELVLWYPPDRSRHLIDDFCSSANLFCSAHHLQQRVGEDLRGGRIMTVDEVAEFGRERWSDVAGMTSTTNLDSSVP